ncbi:cilium assembly protein DZIP1L [Anopheles cruzii]|uniref:cilium assembly protein DZIP1L n=1 Tax=Anopheles cruzii TaxID=68878 RepID=UPI0022EC5C97|nr:cilium assembly protein DZIP1L [Anopheles cruzii]
MSSKWHHNFPKIAREAGFAIRELSIGHCIDWRFVASIDPYAIVSECDYEKLDEFIPHISEVPIGTVLNNRILDPAIGKYFILAQFSIQYLLFCKQFLDETVVEIRNTIQALQSENGRLEKLAKKRNDENALLQRKLQRAEELQNHQQTTVYPCSRCTKNFISPELLSAHILRKHASARPPSDAPVDHNPSDTDKSLINTIKLELEVKQLKERLNAAEKDLHGHRSAKGHRCRVCSDESRTVTPQQQENAPRQHKILHSIGIQSNLTDDKDCNEKEVQTQTDRHSNRNLSPSSPVELLQKELPNEQTISKADLQSFLEEQKQLYEFWKTNERQNIHQEIEAVKKNLVDAIQTIERSERTTPLPMADESVWKDRYQELEKMYEGSQKQARETMVTFEEAYTQKMEQLEKLLLKTHEADEGKDVPLNRTKNVTRNQGQSAPLKLITLPEITIEGAVAPPGLENLDNIEKDKQSFSSETESTESDTEVVPIERSKDLRITKHPNDSVDVAHQEPQNALPQSYPAKTLLLSPKKQILHQFRSRLKAIGIDPRAKQLTVDGFNVAGEALAQQRDVQKKKHKHFFITRNQLLSKVEQMARVKVGENSTPVANAPPLKGQPNVIPKASKPTTRLRSSPTVELLPLKQSLQISETSANLSTDMSMFRTKSSITTSVPTARPLIKLAGDDVITVHAELTPVTVSRPAPHSPVPPKRSSISTSDQHVERLLDTPIKMLNTLALTATNRHDTVEKQTSDISEILETVPFQPKPIPKKRVLFNLDRVDGTAAVGSSISKEPPAKPKSDHLIALSEVPQHRARVDDDSDWNISSFDDDK